MGGAMSTGSGKWKDLIDEDADDESEDRTVPCFDCHWSAEETVNRSQTKQRLKIRECSLLRLCESSDLGIVEWDGDGALLDANDAFLRIVGYTREEVQFGSLHWRSFTRARLDFLRGDSAQDSEAGGLISPCEVALTRKDGVPVHVLMGVTLDGGPPGSGIAYVLDLSHQKSLERELYRSIYDLEWMNRRLENEMQTASQIQQAMIGAPPDHPSLDAEIYTRTARILGGDVLDTYLTSDDRLAIAVADVSGKGSPAALAGAALVGMLDDIPQRLHSPAETLDHLNRRLGSLLPGSMFITMFYALLDLKSGRLTYAQAGHEPSILVRQGGCQQELLFTGYPLGMFEDTAYEEREETLHAGDLLFCYTDGLIDQRLPHGSRVGIERLRRLLRERSSSSSADLIRTALERFKIGELDLNDDVTMLALRLK